jgi:hypothetical protein
VCDLLVVFENDVIIFSDKNCNYPDTGDEQRDWSRWFRSAVSEGAKSTWGAERWIRQMPDRLFLDAACTKRFPLPLPNPSSMVVHRVVVAHGASERSRRYFGGGSGSLVLCPSIVGEMHEASRDREAMPFVVGDLDPERGYVHVLDDATVGILLGELSTISDFVAYLEGKERLIRSGRLIVAAGEEHLLATYQRTIKPDGSHDFSVAGATHVVAPDGVWEEFVASNERRARERADEISYLWDQLLDQFVEHLLTATQYFGTGTVEEQEKVFRFMARESRTRRRMLSNALVQLVEQTPLNHTKGRIVTPSSLGEPHYVFLLHAKRAGQSDPEYRDERASALFAYCMAAKAVTPEAVNIVGIATETGYDTEDRSEDMFYLDASDWTPEQQGRAEKLRAEHQIFQGLKRTALAFSEYPSHERPDMREVRISGKERNHPCPCGSGKKLKKCHGANR